MVPENIPCDNKFNTTGSGVVLVWQVNNLNDLTVGVHFLYKGAKIVTFLSFLVSRMTVTGY